jgi:hypothetical protein
MTAPIAGGIGPDQMVGHLRGGWLRVGRVAWLLVVGTALLTFMASVPVGYRVFSTPCAGEGCLEEQITPEMAQRLAEAGLPPWFYAAYNTALAVGLVLAGTAVALVIVWRRSDEAVALYVSATLVLLSIFINTYTSPLKEVSLGWFLLVDVLESLMWVLFPVLFYIFPNGHFVPRWTRWLVPLWIYIQLIYFVVLAAVLTGEVLVEAALPGTEGLASFLRSFIILNPGDWPLEVQAPIYIGLMLTCVVAVVYRFRRASGPTERQQTKWVVYGLVCVVSAIVLVTVLGELFVPELLVSGTFTDILIDFLSFIAIVFLPLTFGIAILRYRLWDIDLLIRRTLSYAVLTAGLAAAYLVSVVVLQGALGALTGSRQPALVTVLSTLTIAGLFTPLRWRVQASVDQRFYRRKYDAAQTLARFGETLRDDVDLNTLTTALLGVVEETMQPAHVALWVRPTDHESQA